MPDVFTVVRGGFRAAKGFRKASQDKVLSLQELKAVLSRASSDPRKYGRDAWDLFVMAANFGLRAIEVRSLEWDDFRSLEMGYFRVPTAKKRASISGGDRMYVDPSHVELIRSVLDSRRKASRSGLLFPMSERTLRYLWAYYADKARLSPNVSFHALRHTAARMVLEAAKGMEYPERIVNAFLRHKPTTTQIYLQPTAAEMIEVMRRKGVVR